MRAYEIHASLSGRCKTDSVSDYKDLALFEAQRMDRSICNSSVHDVEEAYSDRDRKMKARTIFRGTKVIQSNGNDL